MRVRQQSNVVNQLRSQKNLTTHYLFLLGAGPSVAMKRVTREPGWRSIPLIEQLHDRVQRGCRQSIPSRNISDVVWSVSRLPAHGLRAIRDSIGSRGRAKAFVPKCVGNLYFQVFFSIFFAVRRLSCLYLTRHAQLYPLESTVGDADGSKGFASVDFRIRLQRSHIKSSS